MIMTEVSAVVAADRADDVPVAFDEVLQRPLPDGLIRTELLAGRDGEWKVQTVWRDPGGPGPRAAGPPPAGGACHVPAVRRRTGRADLPGPHEAHRAPSSAKLVRTSAAVADRFDGFAESLGGGGLARLVDTARACRLLA